MADIRQKVKFYGKRLEQWGKEVTGKFGVRINQCKTKLKQLRQLRDSNSVRLYKEVNKELFLILDQREIFWRQRSKQLWLN